MRGQGTIRVALAFAVLLASQALVVWRQSRAVEVLRELDADRRGRAAAESERTRLNGRAQVLESRARIRSVAEQRLGMRVPTPDELVVLVRPDAPRAAPLPGTRVAIATSRGGSQ